MVKKDKSKCYECNRIAKIKVDGISSSYYCCDCYKTIICNEIFFTTDKYKTLKFLVSNTTQIV